MNAIVRSSALVIAASVLAVAQQSTTANSNGSEKQLAEAVGQLQEQITRLQNSVAELRSEADRYRVETQELERRLELMTGNKVEAEHSAAVSSTDNPAKSSEADEANKSTTATVSKLEEEYALLTGQVDDQYQTKVESGSKYRVRLSGLVMLNLFSSRGVTDSIDSPTMAIPGGAFDGGGSFAGTLRQSQMGIEVFGPQWEGAKVTGDLRFDFAGGFPDTESGVTLGLMRLRTGNIRLNWSHTALVAGQDAPMFSPLSPTSVIALAQPEFSYAGNLWTWVPQLQVQHWVDIGHSQRLSLSAGILDSLTGEPPRSQFERAAQAGEASRQPGYSARIGWSDLSKEDHPLAFNIGGYFSRQNWGFNRIVNGWAATADWQIPFSSHFGLKGELYRGQALGGFDASAGQSVLSTDILQNRLAVVHGLNTIGGWAQASFQASPVLEFNAGYGLDNPLSNQFRRFALAQNLSNRELSINRTAMANAIYRPRSDLLLSVEYRHLQSARLASQNASAGNLGLGIGLLF